MDKIFPYFLGFASDLCYNHFRYYFKERCHESNAIPFSTPGCDRRPAVFVRGVWRFGTGTDSHRFGPQCRFVHGRSGDTDLPGDHAAQCSADLSGLLFCLHCADHLRRRQMGYSGHDERLDCRRALLCRLEPPDPGQRERVYPPASAADCDRSGDHDHRIDPCTRGRPDGYRAHRRRQNRSGPFWHGDCDLHDHAPGHGTGHAAWQRDDPTAADPHRDHCRISCFHVFWDCRFLGCG